ncbi:MAG: sugar phosphate isomerase/epimerase [Candidatus Omnitrophica bacterium]|nr:sugar phosphate isomerase/epimerase [Candidatus Omnitrophota bacterium]
MYSLSTCWNSNRHTDGRAMLREIRELGFEYAELSHGIRISLLPGIIEAVDAGEIKISSLHNFCPLPIGVTHAAPNLFKFTSLDARERENAYRHTLKTIETAARLKAPVVVLHLGCIEMKEYTDRLVELIDRGMKDSPKYERLCQEAAEKRERKKERHLELAYEILRRLEDQVEGYGLKLGVENRQGLEELPLEDDFSFLFKEFVSPSIGYWHDTGHGQIKENLGFIHHEIFLESMAERLLGFHLHDVEYPVHDHRPPGEGGTDFAALKPWVKPQHFKIFELSPGTPVDQLRQGVAYLKSLWGEE